MTRLLLIRHGETDWNLARRVQGATDIPLNDAGRAQAREAAVLVRELLGDAPAVTASSDLSRAVETARIIAGDVGLPEPWTTPLLRERTYGEAEGLTIEEYHERWGAFGEAEPPGAEHRDDLRERAVRGIRAAVAETRRRTGTGGGTLVAVAHGGLIREVISFASGGDFPAEGRRIPNASVHEFLVERDRFRLISHATV